MNLEVLLDDLKKRIDNFLERENELEKEIDELNKKGSSTLSGSELNRLEQARKEYIELKACKVNLIQPKCELIDLCCDAKASIDKLYDESLNKSVRTKIIKDLMEKLRLIKQKNPIANYTKEEINSLYSERNNLELFRLTLNVFNNAIESNLEVFIHEINRALDDFKQTQTKTQKTQTEKSKSNKRGKIIGTIILLGSIVFVLFAAKSCSKDKDKTDDRTLELVEVEETPEVTPTEVVIPTPEVTPEVEKETEFVVDDTPLEIVEDVPTFDPNANKEQDMENRAMDIANTGFFEDLYNSEIVDILDIIYSREMWMTENAGYAQTFNTSFNRIVENYLFGKTTDEDLKKINALRYLAKDNSDLDRFLETYSNLLYNILSEPDNQAAKDEMQKYVTIFGTSLNGFTNEPSVMTEDETFNEHAQVNDFFDWWFAYDSIIKPTYPLYFPKALENVDGMLIEKIMFMNPEERKEFIKTNGLEKYEDDIDKQIKLYELQYLMESALTNHPMFCEIRNVEDMPLSLGGE